MTAEERIAELESEMAERDAQWLDLIEVCERSHEGLGLPLEHGQTQETLSRWTDAIVTMVKNLSLAEYVIRHRSHTAGDPPA